MARLNRNSKAKAIAAKENSQTMVMHALIVTATLLVGILAFAHLAQ